MQINGRHHPPETITTLHCEEGRSTPEHASLRDKFSVFVTHILVTQPLDVLHCTLLKIGWLEAVQQIISLLHWVGRPDFIHIRKYGCARWTFPIMYHIYFKKRIESYWTCAWSRVMWYETKAIRATTGHPSTQRDDMQERKERKQHNTLQVPPQLKKCIQDRLWGIKRRAAG